MHADFISRRFGMATKKKMSKKNTVKDVTKKKAPSKKKVASKKAPVKKKVTAKKKVASKKAPVKKKVASKKTSVKKKVASKKAPVKKKVASKKTSVKKKVASKKTSVKKKAASKKASVKKKAASKKASVKKKAAHKKTVLNKQSVKPTKKKSEGMVKAITINSKKKKVHKKNKISKVTPYAERNGEEYMGVEQTEHFRKILNSWKHDLMQEVDRTVHHMQDEASNFPDPSDRASQEEEFALELRTRDRERKLIRKIDEAILTLDSRDYGYCDVCGIEIGVRRLEARPTATQCIDCKTLDEIKERQLG
jgi:DnaK suppressor protein